VRKRVSAVINHVMPKKDVSRRVLVKFTLSTGGGVPLISALGWGDFMIAKFGTKLETFIGVARIFSGVHFFPQKLTTFISHCLPNTC